MKIKKIGFEQSQDEVRITISFDKNQKREVMEYLSNIATIDETKDYDISIFPKQVKRSLTANAYFWVLLGKLCKTFHYDKDEKYKELIKECSAFYPYRLSKEAYPRYKEIWESKGTGWVVEVLEEEEDFVSIRSYYGSSVYTQSEMSELTEALVRTCKENKIETLTPAEIARLENLCKN